VSAGAGRLPVRLASPVTALLAGGLVLLLLAAAGLLATLAHRSVVSGLGEALLVLAFGAVGVVVAWHQPANPIGWIMLGVAFFFSLDAAAGGYAVIDYRLHQGTLPLGWVAVLLAPSWAPAVFLGALAPLLFPDGRLPSPRWRPVLWVYVAVGLAWLAGAYIITIAAIAGHHVHIDATGTLATLDNPSGAAAWFGVLQAVFFPATAAAWLAWLAAQALSYRRSSGERRQQLKWLLSGATVFIAGSVVTVWLNSPRGVLRVVAVVAGAGMLALPVAIGFGILKFKLYDIDRIISRTLAYAVVTGLLVGVYAGLVLLATQVLPLSAPVAVAGATLAAAALFSPLRRRVQRAVDRRFNRAHYDADAAVAAFAGRLAGAVDLDTVRADLLAAVGRALEPAQAWLWLAPGPGPRRADDGGRARSGRLAADEEHGRVVVERVADVAQHLPAQRVQDPVGVTGFADGARLGEREELTGPATRLADPVGVKQDLVARADLDHRGPAG
jgi:hypothetical protein